MADEWARTRVAPDTNELRWSGLMSQRRRLSIDRFRSAYFPVFSKSFCCSSPPKGRRLLQLACEAQESVGAGHTRRCGVASRAGT